MKSLSNLVNGSETKFKGVVVVNKNYYIYSDSLKLREAYAWTEAKVLELKAINKTIVKAYVQTV